METEEEIFQRVKEYLKEEENAKKKNSELARRSFENWSKDNIEVIGRANGYHLKVVKEKFGKIWKWLFG